MPLRLASLSHDAMLVVTALSTAPQGTRFTVGNLTRNNGFDSVNLFAEVQTDEPGEVRNMLVMLSGGGLPLLPGAAR